MSNASERPYCTCNRGKVIDPDRATTQYETDIDRHGYCIYCNHAAIWKTIKYEIYPRGESIGGYKPVSECRQNWNYQGHSVNLFDAVFGKGGVEAHRYTLSKFRTKGGL